MTCLFFLVRCSFSGGFFWPMFLACLSSDLVLGEVGNCRADCVLKLPCCPKWTHPFLPSSPFPELGQVLVDGFDVWPHAPERGILLNDEAGWQYNSLLVVFGNPQCHLTLIHPFSGCNCQRMIVVLSLLHEVGLSCNGFCCYLLQCFLFPNEAPSFLSAVVS